MWYGTIIESKGSWYHNFPRNYKWYHIARGRSGRNNKKRQERGREDLRNKKRRDPLSDCLFVHECAQIVRNCARFVHICTQIVTICARKCTNRHSNRPWAYWCKKRKESGRYRAQKGMKCPICARLVKESYTIPPFFEEKDTSKGGALR